MLHEQSAGAVIFRRENNQIYYLLLKAKTSWNFPKGNIEEGEKPYDTAMREIEEETGIKDIKFINGFKEQIKYFFRKTYNLKSKDKKKGPLIFKIVIFYLAETKTKNVRISIEHIGYKWLLYQEALKQITFKNAKEILKKANDYLVSKKNLSNC